MCSAILSSQRVDGHNRGGKFGMLFKVNGLAEEYSSAGPGATALSG